MSGTDSGNGAPEEGLPSSEPVFYPIDMASDRSYSGNAVMLIDLENFYLGREFNFHREFHDEMYDFSADLADLVDFAEEIAHGRRMIVNRAYANFNDRRPGDGERRWDYYLQSLPRLLMEQGVEPVQVFRFPGGSSKNAADMRLAMDATALANSSDIQQFILVTGDSDFIPVVLELKRRGAEVCVIGVSGSTKSIFQRYCDRFEYFEDLVAASEVEADDEVEFSMLRDSVHALLERRRPIRFAAVKPLLSKETDRPFDPTRYECESTGEFLRAYGTDLGIIVRSGEHDWEIDLPQGDEVPSVEEGPLPVSEGPPPRSSSSSAVHSTPRAAPAEHTPTFYRNLLRYGSPRLYVAPLDDWQRVTELVFQTAAPEGADRPTVFHEDLLHEVSDQCEEDGMMEAGKKVNDTMFILFKSGAFVCADESAPGATDFHWSRAAMLDQGISDVEGLRRCGWAFVVRVLDRRVSHLPGGGSVQPAALAELIYGPSPAEPIVEVTQELIDSVASSRKPIPR